MSFDATFMKGGNLHRLCDITLMDGTSARVEPYAIYTSSKKRRHYLWFEVSGSDSGWRYPEAASVASAALTEEPFTVRADYDPFDKAKFPVVHYSVPTRDGRQRWLDAAPGHDKGTIRNRPL